jgi:hypothetical protein
MQGLEVLSHGKTPPVGGTPWGGRWGDYRELGLWRRG